MKELVEALRGKDAYWAEQVDIQRQAAEAWAEFARGRREAAIENGHWFAAPFAALFTFGYAYVATLLIDEQLERRRAERERRSLVPVP